MLKHLWEQRRNIWEQMKALHEATETEARDFSAEEQAQWNTMSAKLNDLDARISQLQDVERREAEISRVFDEINKREKKHEPAPDADTNAQLRAWLKGETRGAFSAKADRPMGTQEFRVLSKLSAGAGANTVKVSFYDQLVAHLIEVAGLMQAGPTVLQTSTGEQIQVPKTTAHSTATLVAEASAIGASDPAFGQVPLDAFKYAFTLQVSNELLNDTSVDLVGYLAMQAGRALGNGIGAHLITGTGSSQPNGVVTAATLGVTGAAAVSGAFTADNLIDLHFSVIAPYRNSPSCAWLMRDATLASVRKLKDTTNQYLWQPSVQLGVPDTLLGKPIVTDPNVAAVALSAKSVVFGDFSQYFVRMVDNIRFERSDEFAFTSDLVTYRAILRGDGDLIDLTGAVKYFQGNAA